MATPVWIAKLLKTFFPFRKPLARLSYIPGISHLMDWMLFRGDEIVYVPKDRVVIQQTIDQPGGTVLPSTLVDHFIEKASYHWVMDHCICRQGDDCKDYPHDLGCIFLGEAALKINPALGRVVTKEEALAHAHRAREMGLVQLIGRDRLDSVWLGATPFGKLMTICNCCPCCCLFRMLPDLKPDISQRVHRLTGVNVWVDQQACNGCGKCVRSNCFVDAIEMKDCRAVITENCRGCGRCVEACPRGAIHLTIEDHGYVHNAIRHISALVDVNGHK